MSFIQNHIVEVNPRVETYKLNVSNHAIERMRERNIARYEFANAIEVKDLGNTRARYKIGQIYMMKNSAEEIVRTIFIPNEEEGTVYDITESSRLLYQRSISADRDWKVIPRGSENFEGPEIKLLQNTHQYRADVDSDRMVVREFLRTDQFERHLKSLAQPILLSKNGKILILGRSQRNIVTAIADERFLKKRVYFERLAERQRQQAERNFEPDHWDGDVVSDMLFQKGVRSSSVINAVKQFDKREFHLKQARNHFRHRRPKSKSG